MPPLAIKPTTRVRLAKEPGIHFISNSFRAVVKIADAILLRHETHSEERV
jgi:hypothetical protein